MEELAGNVVGNDGGICSEGWKIYGSRAHGRAGGGKESCDYPSQERLEGPER